MSIQLLSNEVNNALVTKTLASGFTKVSVLNRKAYGEKFNLKGQALKKAHSVYLAETTNLASGDVAKQLASGNIRVVSVTPNRHGFNIQTKTKEAIYGAKSFDHGAIASKEKDDKLKASEALLQKQWAKMRELGMSDAEIEELIKS